MKKKTVALLLALVLVIGCAIGGTVAWLVDSTAPVVNTFSSSNINIELTETTGAEYQMVPGATITKDPVVTVKAGSEDCWLFVKLEKSNNYSTYLANYVMNYTSTEGDMWKPVYGVSDVYYIKDATAGESYPVLKGNSLTVNTTVTKANMDAIDGIVVTDKGDGTTTTTTNDAAEIALRPTLTVTAYAIQSANLAFSDEANTEAQKAAEAWALVQANLPTNP